MIKVGDKSKLHFHWKVNPYDFSKEKENNLIEKISNKYSITKDRIKIIPEFIMINSEGEKISVTNDIISNIQNPSFQQELFKEYILVNGIKDFDFELIKKIDSELNGKINYEVYDKFRQYSIKWVKWSNFLSYGENNFFDFTNLNGLVLLNGEPANQSGKTTFAIDLLHFLLFGKTTKATTQEKIFNKHIPEATEVVVEGCICIEGEEYVIKRTLKRPSLQKRSSRSKTVQKVEYYRIISGEEHELVDYVDNQQEENSIQTNKVIKEAIGNENDFDMIICATSSNLDELIEKKETDRGRLLSRWIGLLPIEEKDVLAREKFNSEVKPYLLSNRYNTEELKHEIELNNKYIESYNAEIKKYSSDNVKLNSLINENELTKNNLISLKISIDESILGIDIKTLNTKMEKLLADGKRKAEEISTIERQLLEIGEIDFSMDGYDKLVEQKNMYSNQLVSVTEKYRYLTNLVETIKKSEICPTCGRRYDNVDNTAKLKELNGEIELLIKNGKDIRSEIVRYSDLIEKNKENREKVETKSKLMIKKSALDVNLTTLRSEYKDSKKLLDEYNKNNEAIDKNNKLDIEIRNIQSKIENARNTKENNIRYVEKLTNDVATCVSEIKARNEIIDKLKEEAILIKNWRIYLDMVGKNGISKMVLRKTLPIINAQISYLLNDICDFTVEITINDKNDIMFYLVKDGVYSDLTSGSGFERTAAALALRIVLGNISTLPRANFIVLDELLGRVAKENLENINSLLNKISSKYQYIMQISHLDYFKDFSDTVITCTKESNVSKLTVLHKNNKNKK